MSGKSNGEKKYINRVLEVLVSNLGVLLNKQSVEKFVEFDDFSRICGIILKEIVISTRSI